MVLSSDLQYLKENNLKHKSAVLKYIFLHTRLKNVKNFLPVKELPVLQRVEISQTAVC